MEKNVRWRDKVAVITGAASGIGAASAEVLAEHGIGTLILLDVLPTSLDTIVGTLASRHAELKVVPLAADISDRSTLARLLAPVLQKVGKVNILVNSAGISNTNCPEDTETWHRVIDVNLHGTYYVTLEALRFMPDGGRIINVSSAFGRLGHNLNTAYCAAKHGLQGFTKSLALDLALRGITVNAIVPASVDTPMYRRELELEANRAGMPAEMTRKHALANIPMRRFVESREVAAVIAFLASDDASAITAQSHVVDCGQLCGA